MKLVVCYGGGSEGSGFWEQKLCVEYESKDHFLLAFYEAFEAWAANAKERNNLQQKLADARASQDQKKIELAQQRWVDHCKKFQYCDPLVVDGLEFSSFEDYKYVKGEYVILRLPEVYELDEWFELNRAPKYAQKFKEK